MQETWVWFLGWKDPLEQDMVAHTSILAWRIPMDRGPGGLQSMGSQRVGHHRSDWAHAYGDNHMIFPLELSVCDINEFTIIKPTMK